eukprot:ctg_1175.g374
MSVRRSAATVAGAATRTPRDDRRRGHRVRRAACALARTPPPPPRCAPVERVAGWCRRPTVTAPEKPSQREHCPAGKSADGSVGPGGNSRPARAVAIASTGPPRCTAPPSKPTNARPRPSSAAPPAQTARTATDIVPGWWRTAPALRGAASSGCGTAAAGTPACPPGERRGERGAGVKSQEESMRAWRCRMPVARRRRGEDDSTEAVSLPGDDEDDHHRHHDAGTDGT